MDRVAFNAMLAQYATPEVSGDGRVSWDKGVRCVMPSLKLYGKCEQGTLTGKNLFDKSTGYVSGYIERSNNTFIAHGSFATVQLAASPNTQYTAQKVAGKRFIVAEGTEQLADGINATMLIYDNTATKLTFTTGESAKYVYITIWYRSEDTLTIEEIIDSIQVELGSTATAYEPYCGGIPAPNPSYPIPVRCNNGVFALHGDTILDTTQLNTKDFGWISNADKEFSSTTAYYYFEIPAKPNTAYYCIAPYAVLGKSAGVTFICVDRVAKVRNYIYHGTSESLCKTISTITTDETGVLYLLTTVPFNADNVLRSFWLTEYCGQATAPELWGVPAGKYNPEARPEVHDEWNPQTGYGLRRIKKIVFDGTENFSLNAQILQLSGKNAYQCTGNFGFKQSSQNGICSHFEVWQSTGFFRKNTVLVLGSNVIAFMTDGVQTIDEFKTWLAEQAAAGTPVTLWTYVANPEPFYAEPQKLTQPNGPGQIIQVSGDVADCPISARYLTHS